MLDECLVGLLERTFLYLFVRGQLCSEVTASPEILWFYVLRHVNELILKESQPLAREAVQV